MRLIYPTPFLYHLETPHPLTYLLVLHSSRQLTGIRPTAFCGRTALIVYAIPQLESSFKPLGLEKHVQFDLYHLQAAVAQLTGTTDVKIILIPS